jgi:hypothetical protein
LAPGEGLQLGLHLGLQGEKLGLVAELAPFGMSLHSFALALVGLLAEGVALFHDADVELELLLALLLSALEPAAEDLQEGGASSEGGETGDCAVHELAHAGGPRPALESSAGTYSAPIRQNLFGAVGQAPWARGGCWHRNGTLRWHLSGTAPSRQHLIPAPIRTAS